MNRITRSIWCESLTPTMKAGDIVLAALSQISGTLGHIGPDRVARLRDRLARHLHPAT